MSEFWQASAAWLGPTALAGGAVLGGGWLVTRLVRDPARRAAVMGWAVRGAVLTAILCALPGWLTLPTPEWAKSDPGVVVRTQTNRPFEPVTIRVPPCEPPAAEPIETDRLEWVLVEAPAAAAANVVVLDHRTAAGDAAPAAAPPPAAPAPEASGAAETGVARVALLVFGLLSGAAVLQLVAG